jgi:hypothetical protein
MGLFSQCLTPADLRDLTVGELETLKAAFFRELHTNETIKDELRHRLAQTLDMIRAQRSSGADPGTTSG